MKRILRWVEEEKISLAILLLAIGIILNSPPQAWLFAGMFLYGSIIIIILHLVHKLYVKFKK